MYYRHDQMM